MNDLTELANWAGPLIQQLDAKQRSRLMRELIHYVRKQNQKRIKDQVSPDGDKFSPRKHTEYQGKIKRGAMFTKLRLARFMRTSTTPQSAAINILGRSGRIAAEHHYGLRGKVNNRGVEYTYPERKLLGFSSEDREAITSMVLNHLK